MFSEGYHRALSVAKQHHKVSKTYSGKLMRPHAPFILELISRMRCGSVLDYGCGKGKQYTWIVPEYGKTLEELWGIGTVSKYDPAYEPYSKLPEGKFDLVICTHVLGSIPIVDLADIITQLYSKANDAVYIAEKIGPIGKSLFNDKEFPRFNRADWEKVLASIPHEGIEVVLSTTEKTKDGKITIRSSL